MLNGQERFLAALRCEPVDRMPSHWMGITNGGLFQREFDAYQEMDPNPGFDACFQVTPAGDMTIPNWFSRGTSTDVRVGAGGVSFPAAYYNPDKDWFYTKAEASTLPASKKTIKISWFGQLRHLDDRGVGGWYEGPFFHGPDAIERMEAFYAEFGAPWELEPVSNAGNARRILETVMQPGFPHAATGSAPGHFEPIYGGFGPATLSSLMRKHPGRFKAACKQFERHALVGEALSLEAGHQIIHTGDDLGQKDRSLVSPKHYEEFFMPSLKARCDLAHRHGAVVFMHSCGYQEELVPSYMKAGLDGLQSLEVPAGNDLARIRAVVRDKMCLVGGIDTSRVLSFGTPAECEVHVKAQIAAATTLDGDVMDGGYIPGPSHNLMNVPLANVQAVIHAIATHGKYPLARGS